MFITCTFIASSDESIAIDFGISRRSVARKLKNVRQILMDDFVPNTVNFTRSREDLLSHTSVLSKSLLSPNNADAAVVIWDGTYIYLEKSAQHAFQKNSYCSHKKRNYIKPMMIVATDGTIIAVLGPFKATKNDASIATEILSQGHPALENLGTCDVVVLDRGFRDSVREFQSRGLIVKTPACQPLGKQLSVLEANQTRLVTKVRYDVERINGMVKSTFKIFAEVWESLSVPHLMDDLQIVAGLLNEFFIKSNENKEMSLQLANEMLLRVPMENKLAKIINGRSSKFIFSKDNRTVLLENDIFPPLSMIDLRNIAFGEYQIIQSKIYAWDHIKANNNLFEVEIFRDEINEKHFPEYSDEDPSLIMLNINSRFISGKVWRALILFSRIKSGKESILEYCCSCKVGQRTVGCCSHVMTALYYLGFAQYNGGVKEKAKHLRNFF